MEHLRLFGSVVHVKTTKRVSQLEDKSNVMIFIDYELGTKAYRYLNPSTFKVSIGRDVILRNLNVGISINRVFNMLISPSLRPLTW